MADVKSEVDLHNEASATLNIPEMTLELLEYKTEFHEDRLIRLQLSHAPSSIINQAINLFNRFSSALRMKRYSQELISI